MVFCAFDVTKHILNAFGSVRLFKILTKIFRKMVIFSIFLQRPKVQRWKNQIVEELIVTYFRRKGSAQYLLMYV